MTNTPTTKRPPCKEDEHHACGPIETELTHRYFYAARERGRYTPGTVDYAYWDGRAEALREAAQYSEGLED